MRFEVPQFIEIEDKIFGPFTWKQFVYLIGGCGALFMLYVALPFIVFLIVGTPIAALTAALGFYQYNNRPFIFLLEAIFGYFTRAKLYLWKKQDRPIAPRKDAPIITYVKPSATSLTSMARQLEINALQNKSQRRPQQ